MRYGKGGGYRAMISNYLVLKVEDMDVKNLLKETFGERLIFRNEPINWPSKSCDLTPLDYFFGDTLSH